MNKRILGGLAAAAMLTGGFAFTSAGTVSAAEGDEPPVVDDRPEGVCPDYDFGHLSANNQTQFTYTAPEGKIIVALCVKAGSIKQGNGPEPVPGATGRASFTFGHSSGKQISHFSVDLDDVLKPAAVVTEVYNCAAPSIVTVTTAPYVWNTTSGWVLGEPVKSTKASTRAQVESCQPTPPPPGTPVTPTPPGTPVTPTPAPAAQAPVPAAQAPVPEPAVAVAALPPTQAPASGAATQVSASGAATQAPVVPAGGLPATGIDGTGVTALIALLLTSLGGAALFASRRRNVTI